MLSIQDLEKNEFQGPDKSLGISLYEYGLAWKIQINEKTKKEEYKFLYRTRVDEDNISYYDFAYFNHLNAEEFKSEFNWCNFSEIADVCGLSEKEFHDSPFEQKILNLLSYYGCEDVFGSTCWEGYQLCDFFETNV